MADTNTDSFLWRAQQCAFNGALSHDSRAVLVMAGRFPVDHMCKQFKERLHEIHV